jgi:hypothetical protein
MMAIYKRKLTFANSAFEVFTNFPVLIIIDNTAGAYIGLDAYDKIAFFGNDKLPLSWECAEFNASGKSYYFVKVPSIAQSDTDFIWVYWGDLTSAEDKTGVWDSNYKAVYHMKDETTSTILDSTGNNFDGTKNGANNPIQADGAIGKCQLFDVTNDVINCGDTDISEDLSVEAFIQWLDPASTKNIFEKGHPPIRYRVYVANTNAFILHINDGVTDLYRTISGAYLQAVNHFLGVSFNFSNGDIKPVVDGAVATESNTALRAIGLNNNQLRIGSYNSTGGAEPFKGYIYELRISDAVRTPNYFKAQDKILRTQDYVSFGAISAVSKEVEFINRVEGSGFYYTDEIFYTEGAGTLNCEKIVWTEDESLIGTIVNQHRARHLRPLVILIRNQK